MDITPIVFYGCICAGVASLVPATLSHAARSAVGAFVGIAAAIALPVIRAATGL